MKLASGIITNITFIPENHNSLPFDEKFDAPKVIVQVTLDRGFDLTCNIYKDIKSVTSTEINECLVEFLKDKLMRKKVICSDYKIPAMRDLLKEIL